MWMYIYWHGKTSTMYWRTRQQIHMQEIHGVSVLVNTHVCKEKNYSDVRYSLQCSKQFPLERGYQLSLLSSFLLSLFCIISSIILKVPTRENNILRLIGTRRSKGGNSRSDREHVCKGVKAWRKQNTASLATVALRPGIFFSCFRTRGLYQMLSWELCSQGFYGSCHFSTVWCLHKIIMQSKYIRRCRYLLLSLYFLKCRL